jgi:hypothetical protein
LRSDNHFKATSNLFWLLAEMLKQATVLSVKLAKSNLEITYFYCNAPYKSFLFPKANSGIPAKLLLLRS